MTLPCCSCCSVVVRNVGVPIATCIRTPIAVYLEDDSTGDNMSNHNPNRPGRGRRYHYRPRRSDDGRLWPTADHPRRKHGARASRDVTPGSRWRQRDAWRDVTHRLRKLKARPFKRQNASRYLVKVDGVRFTKSTQRSWRIARHNANNHNNDYNDYNDYDRFAEMKRCLSLRFGSAGKTTSAHGGSSRRGGCPGSYRPPCRARWPDVTSRTHALAGSKSIDASMTQCLDAMRRVQLGTPAQALELREGRTLKSRAVDALEVRVRTLRDASLASVPSTDRRDVTGSPPAQVKDDGAMVGTRLVTLHRHDDHDDAPSGEHCIQRLNERHRVTSVERGAPLTTSTGHRRYQGTYTHSISMLIRHNT